MSYYYQQSEPNLWTVGSGFGRNWQAESDWDTAQEAAERVKYLNGGQPSADQEDESSASKMMPEKITLRQYFASQLICGMTANQSWLEVSTMKELIETAFEYADEMIRQSAITKKRLEITPEAFLKMRQEHAFTNFEAAQVYASAMKDAEESGYPNNIAGTHDGTEAIFCFSIGPDGQYSFYNGSAA